MNYSANNELNSKIHAFLQKKLSKVPESKAAKSEVRASKRRVVKATHIDMSALYLFI